MIGALIGAGVSLAGTVAGGILSAKANKKARRKTEEERARNNDWYNRQYNENPLQRSDAQALLKRTEDAIKNRNRAAAGTQAVMGGTEASAQAVRDSNNELIDNTITNIAASNEARRQAAEATYQTRDSELGAQLRQLDYAKAQNTAAAAQGAIQAGAGIAEAFDAADAVNEANTAMQKATKVDASTSGAGTGTSSTPSYRDDLPTPSPAPKAPSTPGPSYRDEHLPNTTIM